MFILILNYPIWSIPILPTKKMSFCRQIVISISFYGITLYKTLGKSPETLRRHRPANIGDLRRIVKIPVQYLLASVRFAIPKSVFAAQRQAHLN
jgi:Ca2+/H+ antiporter